MPKGVVLLDHCLHASLSSSQARVMWPTISFLLSTQNVLLIVVTQHMIVRELYQFSEKRSAAFTA